MFSFCDIYLSSTIIIQIEIPDNIRSQILLGRWGHTATTITHCEGLEEMFMFGGCPGYYEFVWKVKRDQNYPRIAGPISFIFGELSYIHYGDHEFHLLFYHA